MIWNIEEGSGHERGISLKEIVTYISDPTVHKSSISKNMLWLYPSVQITSRPGCGRVYRGIKWVDWSGTVEQANSEFQYPEYVTVLSATAFEIKLSVPTDAIVDGESVHLTVTVRRDGELEIVCLNQTINLQELQISNCIGWSQMDIDKLFILISKLHVCQGMKHRKGSLKLRTVQHWNILGREEGRIITEGPIDTNGENIVNESSNVDINEVKMTTRSTTVATIKGNETAESTDEYIKTITESATTAEASKESTITLSEEDDAYMKAIFMECLEEAPVDIKEFLMSQAGAVINSATGRGWNIMVIAVCMRLWIKTPRGYTGPTQFLALPSGRVLHK